MVFINSVITMLVILDSVTKLTKLPKFSVLVRLGKLESIGKLVKLGIDRKAQCNKKCGKAILGFPA